MENEKRALIICPSMWPRMNSWGETQRMYYLANDLSRNGWKVYTVSPGYEGQQEDTKREQLYTSFFLGNKKIQAEPVKTNHKEEAVKRAGLKERAMTLLSPVVKWLYNEPDCYEGISKQLWMLKYRKKILDLIARETIQTVIISVPTFVLLGLGPLIKKKFPQIFLIYDYRDPWFLWNRKRTPAFYNEKRYLSYADRIIGFSEIFSADLIKEMGVEPEKVRTVYNGYSEKDWTAFEKKGTAETAGKKLRLSYVGNISLQQKGNFRNPQRLMQVVQEFPNMELYLIGVQGAAAESSEGNIHFIGKVSQMEAFHDMLQSDVLISIHDTDDCSGNYLISGKFFDYMRSGKVMFHIGGAQSLMSRMIRQYRLGVASINTYDELRTTMEELLKAWQKGGLDSLRKCPKESVRDFSREHQNAVYCRILQENRCKLKSNKYDKGEEL